MNYLKEKESLNQYTIIVNMDETPTWFLHLPPPSFTLFFPQASEKEIR
jgi:hypothetical protein